VPAQTWGFYPEGVSAAREERLVEAFVEVADTLVDDFDDRVPAIPG